MEAGLADPSGSDHHCPAPWEEAKPVDHALFPGSRYA
jgi:hypothetical protein